MIILQTNKPSNYYDNSKEKQQKIEDAYRYIAEVYLLELQLSIEKKQK